MTNNVVSTEKRPMGITAAKKIATKERSHFIASD